MLLGTKEHYDLMAQFEKEYYHMRLDRVENKNWQRRGDIYQSGETNALFNAYRRGYSFGKISSQEMSTTDP